MYSLVALEARKGLWGELRGLVSEIMGMDNGERIRGKGVTVLQLTLLKEIRRAVSLQGKPHIIGS